jgi:hypothetical protein
LAYSTLSARSRDGYSATAAWGANTALDDQNDPTLARKNLNLSGWGIVGFSQSAAYEEQSFLHFDYVNANGTATTTRLAINAAGNVGIGTAAPLYTLDVAGDINLTGALYQNGTPIPATQWTTNDSNIYYNDGSVSVGTTTSASMLTVQGIDTSGTTANLAFLDSDGNAELTVFNDGNAVLAGSLAQNSDERLKTNVQPLDGSSTLALINALDPVTFNWINNLHGSTTQSGFIAQEVQKVFPTLVSTTSPTALTPDGTLGVNYLGFIAPLVSAVQELFRQVNSLASVVTGFAESFTTKVVHTDEICVKKSDGTEFCANGDQLSAMAASLGGGTGGGGGDAPAPSDPTPPSETSVSTSTVSAPDDSSDDTASSSPDDTAPAPDTDTDAGVGQ